jgi:hypothetical protein
MYNIINKRIYIIIFLLLIKISYVYNSKSAIIPTSVLIDENNRPCYVAYIEIGSPIKSLILQISFDETNLIIFNGKNGHNSISMIQSNDINYEIIYIGGESYYIPIEFDSSRRYYLKSYSDENVYINPRCDGIIGLSDASIFWKLWNEITFTPNFIELGYPFTMNQINQMNENNFNKKIYCEQNLNTFCGIKAFKNNEEEDNYLILINSQLISTYIPSNIYESYFSNKNMYNIGRENWEDIDFHAPSVVNQENSNETNFGELNIKFKSNTFILNKNRDVKQLMINKISKQKYYNGITNENTIITGINFLQDKLIYKNKNENYIKLYTLDISEHYSFFNLAVFIILFFLFLRWKLTDPVIKLNSNDESTYFYNGIVFIYEIIGILITLITYVLPSTQKVLILYPVVNAFIPIIIVLCVLSEIIGVIYLLLSTKKPKNQSIQLARRDMSIFYQANIIRNISHDTILLHGMWLILIQRTKIDLSILPTVLINVYIYFNLSFYGIQLFFYNLLQEHRPKLFNMNTYQSYNMFVLVYAFTIFQFIYIAQIIFTSTYFVKPYVRTKASYLNDIDTQLTIIVFGFLFILSFWKTRLYLRKHIIDSVKYAISKEKERKIKKRQ